MKIDWECMSEYGKVGSRLSLSIPGKVSEREIELVFLFIFSFRGCLSKQQFGNAIQLEPIIRVPSHP